jgi:hypothetical protein
MHTHASYSQLHRESMTALMTGPHTLEEYQRTKNFLIYESLAVPGVLQIPAYTEAIIGGWSTVFGENDSPLAEAANREVALSVRTERAAMLGAPGKYFWILLEEQVLRAQVTSNAHHSAQLEHIITAMDLPGVEIEVIPANVKRYVAPVADFYIFDERVAMTDTPFSVVTTTDPAEIRQLIRLRGELRSHSVFDDKAKAIINHVTSSM